MALSRAGYPISRFLDKLTAGDASSMLLWEQKEVSSKRSTEQKEGYDEQHSQFH